MKYITCFITGLAIGLTIWWYKPTEVIEVLEYDGTIWCLSDRHAENSLFITLNGKLTRLNDCKERAPEGA